MTPIIITIIIMGVFLLGIFVRKRGAIEMKNSADIRRDNKKSIYRFLLEDRGAVRTSRTMEQPEGERLRQYTKQEVAAATGLSPATCNTLLNDMERAGIVQGGRKKAGDVGRSSVLYQIREDHEHYLALYFYVEHGKKIAVCTLLSAAGNVWAREEEACDLLDYTRLVDIIFRMTQRYGLPAQIIVGVPGIAEDGVIRHCDIPELEGEPLKRRLEDGFSIPVAMETDMHFKAYGYYRKNGRDDEVTTRAYFPSHVLPGTATIHRGTIISGSSGFAGMTGFLPSDVSREEQLELLNPKDCLPFLVQSLSAVIVLLNPGKIVLTGDLVTDAILLETRKKCLEYIPQEYMPEFLRVDSFDDCYLEGMFQTAVDRKEM